MSFPPAFNGDPFAYGMALAGLLIMTTLSASRMIHLARCIDPKNDGWTAPVTHFRIAKIMLFMTIFIGCFPDLAILLSWNEISPDSMARLLKTDRIFDGLAPIPFVTAIVLFIRGESGMVDQLRRPPVPSDILSTWHEVRRNISIIGMVILVASGISMGKIYHVGCEQSGECVAPGKSNNH